MVEIYRISKEKLGENAFRGIQEFIKIRSKKGHRCDKIMKVWCSWVTSLLDIDQQELGYRCTQNCPFKNAEVYIN